MAIRIGSVYICIETILGLGQEVFMIRVTFITRMKRLSIYLSIYLSVCLSVYLSICRFVYLCIYLSIYRSVCLSPYLSACLVGLSIRTPLHKLLNSHIATDTNTMKPSWHPMKSWLESNIPDTPLLCLNPPL